MRRLYEVIAFLPGRVDAAVAVNGAVWTEGGEPFPNVVVFKPYVAFPERDYLALVEELAVGSVDG